MRVRYGPGWWHPEASPLRDIQDFKRDAEEEYREIMGATGGGRVRLGRVVILGSFESASKPGTYHTQMHHGDGRISCDCRGYVNHEHCWHIEERRRELAL